MKKLFNFCLKSGELNLFVHKDFFYLKTEGGKLVLKDKSKEVCLAYVTGFSDGFGKGCFFTHRKENIREELVC